MPAPQQNRVKFLYIGIIVILLAVIAYPYAQNFVTTTSQKAAVDSAVGVYSSLTEKPVSVLAVREQSGLYRVTLQTTAATGQQSTQDVFVTKDGLLITDTVINATGYVQLLESQKNFTDCLYSKGVRIAGLQNDVNTLTQLRILGNYAYKLFIDCSGANLQICQNAGIQNVPTVIVNSSFVTGVQQLGYFTALGCKL